MTQAQEKWAEVSRAVPFGAALVALLVALLAVALSWSPAGAHTPHDSAGAIAVSPEFAQDQTLLVTTEGRLVRSQDGGTTWHPVVNGLPTRTLRDVTFAGPTLGRAYVAAEAGVFVSDNGGDNWDVALPSSEGVAPWHIAASPTDPDHAVVLTLAGGLLATRDGGDSWQPIDDIQGSASAVAFAVGDAELLVVGLRAGSVQTSTDGGLTMSPLRPVPGEGGIGSVHARVGQGGEAVVYAGQGAGELLRSADGGATFAETSGQLPIEMIRSITTDVDDDGVERLWVSTNDSGVWASEDAGATWEWRAFGLTSDGQAVKVDVAQFRSLGLGHDASGERMLFLAGFDGMFRSGDDGRTWTALETLSEMITGLSVSPAFADDGEVVISTYVKGTYRSRDGGQTWEFIADDMREGELRSGNEYLPVRRLHDVVHSPTYASDRTLFSATWTRLLRSTDAGDSWTSEFVSEPPPDSELRGFKIAVSPDFETDGTIYLGTRQGEVFRSTKRGDGGSFERMGSIEGEVRMIVLSPDFATDQTLFLGSHSGVYRSLDGGATWESTGPATTSLLAISPDFPSDGTVFAATTNGLWVTRDGGEEWTEITGPVGTGERVEGVGVSPRFADDGTVLASVRSRGLFRSQDGGVTFHEVGEDLTRQNILITDFITNPSSTPIHFSPAFAVDRTVFGFAENRVVVSHDGAETWEILPVPDSRDFPLDPDFVRPAASLPVIHRDVVFPPGVGETTTGDAHEDGGRTGPWIVGGMLVALTAATVVRARSVPAVDPADRSQ